MSLNKQQKEENLYNFFYNNLKITKPFKVLKVDFEKPWYDLFLQVKWTVLATFSFNIVRNLYFTLIPITIGYIVSNQQYWLFNYFFLVWAFIQIFAFFINPFWIRLYSRILGSVKYNAQNYFLKSDPINHSLRSSGQIIAKVSRGSQAYDEILFLVTEDIFPIAIKSLTAASTLFVINWVVGLIGLLFVSLSLILSTILNINVEKLIEPQVILADDETKQVEVENLAQVALIRSIFSTEIQIVKAEKTIQKSFANWNLKYRIHHFSGQILNVLFLVFLGFLFANIVTLIQNNQINSILAISIMVGIALNLTDLLWIGNKLERLIKSVIEAQDLFEFIRNFGKQTYPVLDGEETFKS